jgi:hypothetical protein
MKTFYTLLIVCGLFFTSHAQESLAPINFNDNSIQSNNIYVQELSDLLNGSFHTLIFTDHISSLHEEAGTVKRIQLVNTNSLSLLNSNPTMINYNDVEVLEFNYANGNVFNAPSGLNSLFPNLKYIYISSYDLIDESSITTALNQVINQFSDVKVIYQILENR